MPKSARPDSLLAVVIAVMFCAAGITWAAWVLFRGAPNSSPAVLLPQPASARVAIVASTPPPTSRPSDDAFNAAVKAASDAIATAAAKLQLSPPSSADTDAIGKEAAETLSLFVLPDGERTREFLIARGDENNKINTLSPGEREKYIQTTAQCFAGQQPDLSKVEIRWRYIDGREVEKPANSGSSTPRRTFDDVMYPEKSGLTAIEVIIPVPVKTLMMGTKRCRLGLLIGKTREKPTWRTMQTRSYDIPGNAGLLFPPH
ncbi:MAG: hypothetical protein U0570_03875 [Phycisphaerales bacterium]